jgi:uncharacterized repeat protein (TIGR01451 family)
MKTIRLWIITGMLASYFSLPAQFCWIDVFSLNPTFPYVCNGDTFKFQLYTSGTRLDSAIVFWGDNTSDTFITNQQQFYPLFKHVYSSTGIYYPYFKLFSSDTACSDTLLPFRAYGRLHPNSQDSLSYGYYNYVIVVDSCTSISGKVYIDKDNSCTYNSGDVPLANQQVVVLDNNQIAGGTFTDAAGNYTVFAPPSFSVRIMPYNHWFSALQPSCNTSQANNQYIPNSSNDFIFQCPSGYDVSITGTTGFFAQVVDRGLCFSVRNNSCNTYFNAVVTFHLSNKILLNTGQQAVVYYSHGTTQYINPTISGNTVSITGINVMPLSVVSGCLQARANPQLTTNGDTICYMVSVSPTAGDLNPSNNYDTVCATVLTSYDPNDKGGIAGSRSAHGVIKANQELVYHIRFQNTGSFPARDVRIVDTLDAKLEASSVEILGYSHPVTVQQSGRVLTFFFDEIWLPDSASNEPASHGHVTFRIQQKPNLPPATTIKNFVDIYFDYNPPIRTNTVVSVIESLAGVLEKSNDLDAWLYPNPTQDKFTIRMSTADDYKVKIYDLTGSILLENRFYGDSWTWGDVKWVPGIYWVEITTALQHRMLKLMVK